MSYNLFLDDLRNVKTVYPEREESEFIVVRNYEDFVSTMQKRGVPRFISFDNDLGQLENGELAPDGYACAKWLVYDSGFDLRNLKYFVHSANPVAKSQINSLLENYIAFLKSDSK